MKKKKEEKIEQKIDKKEFMKQEAEEREKGDSLSIEKDTEDTMEKLKEECSLLWDKYARLQAEFDNYKKRSCKERTEFIKFANENLILELLDILDNFERGIKAAEVKKDFDLLHQGVDMISRQLHSLLEAKGLTKIISVGRKFDPHLHEAVEVTEEEGVEADLISEELQKGYILNSRIIRPARVKVLKRKAKKEQKEQEEEQIEPGEGGIDKEPNKNSNGIENNLNRKNKVDIDK